DPSHVDAGADRLVPGRFRPQRRPARGPHHRPTRRSRSGRSEADRHQGQARKGRVMPAKGRIPAGEKITIDHDKRRAPDHPIDACIEGDGTGPDIWRAAVSVLDAAVEQAYRGRRKIAWAEVYAGEKAQAVYGKDCPPNLLPEETLDVIREYLVA